jgi:hypothetical protein
MLRLESYLRAKDSQFSFFEFRHQKASMDPFQKLSVVEENPPNARWQCPNDRAYVNVIINVDLSVVWGNLEYLCLRQRDCKCLSICGQGKFGSVGPSH